MLRGVFVCADAAEVARAAARRFVDWAWQAIARDGHFHVALSGGLTPCELYRLLATSEFRVQVDWPRVHLFWGDAQADHPLRVEEARQLANHLADRVEGSGARSRNLFVLGDFNIFEPDGEAMEALEAAGFQIPVGRANLRATNVGLEGRYYDQIAYLFLGHADLAPTRIGVIDPFEVVYSDAKFVDYEDELRTAGGDVPGDPLRYYRNTFRRRELSDHLPLWAELPIEFANDYLEQVAGG